jgi:hypothetical protein
MSGELHFMKQRIRAIIMMLIITNTFIYAQQNCTDPGNNTGDLGCVTFNYQGQSVIYTTVRGADGKVWLQQNLGSSRVANAMTDTASYGDLFQWGRWDDGHQLRNSATVSTPSTNAPNGLTGINSYIIGSGTDSWWATNAVSDRWVAENSLSVTSENGADPCKAIGQDWKMPSQNDWAQLVSSESINNPASAFASHLKLPAGGYRSNVTGGFTFVDQRGYFWSSDAANSGGKYLYIGTAIANASSGGPRGQGASVRCMKEASALGTNDIRYNNISEVYPNPTNNILYIKSDTNIETVSVTNVAGQKINVQFSNNQISMQNVPNGVYIVEIKLKTGQIFSKKVIKN